MSDETDVITVLPPPLFNYDADDLLGEWKQWFQKLEEYLFAYDQADSPDEDKIRVLLNHLGNEGKEIYESLESNDHPGERLTSFAELTEAFAAYFESAKNVLFERFRFFRLTRKPELRVMEFVNELTKAASCCEFVEKENIIRDKLLEQIQDKSLIERLLVEGGSLTLQRAVKICQKWENRKGQANENKPPKPGIDPEPPKASLDTSYSRKRNAKQVKCAELPVVTILGVVPQLMNNTRDEDQNTSVETNIWDNDDSRDYSDSRGYSEPENTTVPKSTDKRGSMCEVCGKIFALPCLLKRHMDCHSGKRYACTKCDFRAALRSTVNSHMRIHEGRKFSCNMCDFKARRSYGLKMHKLTNHSDERPFKCDKCERRFPDLGSLNFHKKTRHLSDTDKPDGVQYSYTCDTCGHKFISESRYKLHIEAHKGDPYHCYACNYKTTSRNSIIRHLAQQHGSQTFSCDVCGFSAKCRRRIRSHKRIHGSQTENDQCLTLQTLAQCDICGLNTKGPTALSKHKRIHGARDIACGFCEFKSYKRATMIAHTRRHTGERPFECSFCGYKAAQHGTLRKHIEVMHNKDSTTNKKSKGGSQPASNINSDQNVDSSHHNPLVYPPNNNPAVDASYNQPLNHSYHNPHVPSGNPSVYLAPNYHNPLTNTYYNNPNVDMGHNNSPFDLDQFVRSNMIS